MYDIINIAIQKGATLYVSISGGKDGDAMTHTLVKHGYPIKGLLHADLGRAAWKESELHCEKIAHKYALPLHFIQRRDKQGLMELMRSRLKKLLGTGKPFWPSSKSRYCTSDEKRDPINVFFNNCGSDFIISAEGIRALESRDRAKKQPLQIRWRCTSSYYKDMTPEQAIAAYVPGKKLVLTWYPVFNFTVAEVWQSGGNTAEQLTQFRREYKETGIVNPAWNFNPVYVYGNERVSCVFCILGCEGDLQVGAHHRPELLEEYLTMEEESGSTFKKGFSLKQLLN